MKAFLGPEVVFDGTVVVAHATHAARAEQLRLA
jgi:hypothetical protein